MQLTIFIVLLSANVTAALLWFSLARLDAIFAHRQRPVDAMQLEVEATCVAHGFAIVVATPQSGRPGAAVGATQTEASRRGLYVYKSTKLTTVFTL